jgi:hypothetical protein
MRDGPEEPSLRQRKGHGAGERGSRCGLRHPNPDCDFLSRMLSSGKAERPTLKRGDFENAKQLVVTGPPGGRDRVWPRKAGPVLFTRVKKLSTAVVIAASLAATTPAVAGAGVGDNMDGRTRAFVRQLHGCEAVTGLAIQIVGGKPNDLIGASQAINSAKSTCSAIRDRMATMDTRHFSDQALNGEVAVDYWTRGLGRFSNYIDDGRPSDVSKAAEYFTDARTFRGMAMRGINRRRSTYGLSPLK